MTAFRVPRTPLVALAIPAAVLTGLAFPSVIMAYTATLKTGHDFNVLFRFVMTPLFHGVELTRELTLGTLDEQGSVIHVAYLATMFLAGAASAVWTFDRALRK